MNIFLCHSSHDHARAAAFAPLLREKGHDVFIDRCSSPLPDESWRQEVLQNLDMADCVVALISKALATPYVFFELTYSRIRARTRGVPILVPVIVDDEHYGVAESLFPRLSSLGVGGCADRVHSLVTKEGKPGSVLVAQRSAGNRFVSQIVETGAFPARAGEALAELILGDRLPITGEFVAASSYPYARLMAQLPYQMAGEITERLLMRSLNGDVVRHALHIYGLVHTSKFASGEDALRRLSAEIAPNLTKRFVGRDGGVLRQLDFATAQLGSEEARERFLRILDTDEGKTFDSSFIPRWTPQNRPVVDTSKPAS